MTYANTFFLDAGHAGQTVSGFYLTPGKRSPEPPPVGIYEGVNNRLICDAIVEQGRDLLIEPTVSNCIMDISLGDRVDFINDECKRIGKQNALSLSVHSNAAGDGSEWNDATGFTIFHYPNSSKGIAFAEILEDELKKVCPYPSRGLKETSSLYMVKGPACPAVLCEFGFHTNKGDTEFLGADSGRWLMGGAVCRSMHRYNVL